MLDTPQAGFNPLKSLKKPLSKSDLVGELPTGFFVFYRSVFDRVGAAVVRLWRGCQLGFHFLPAFADPQGSPGPSPDPAGQKCRFLRFWESSAVMIRRVLPLSALKTGKSIISKKSSKLEFLDISPTVILRQQFDA